MSRLTHLHYHELLDRCDLIRGLIENSLCNHVATNENMKKILAKADVALADFNHEVLTIISDEFLKNENGM